MNPEKRVKKKSSDPILLAILELKIKKNCLPFYGDDVKRMMTI